MMVKTASLFCLSTEQHVAAIVVRTYTGAQCFRLAGFDLLYGDAMALVERWNQLWKRTAFLSVEDIGRTGPSIGWTCLAAFSKQRYLQAISVQPMGGAKEAEGGRRSPVRSGTSAEAKTAKMRARQKRLKMIVRECLCQSAVV